MADECIKVDDAINRAYELYEESDFIKAEELSAFVKSIPVADVRPVVHARWLNVVSAIVDTTGNCSECRKEAVWRTRNKPYTICPNCGAKMDGEG